VKDLVVPFDVVCDTVVGQQEIAEMGSNMDVRIRVPDGASLSLASHRDQLPALYAVSAR
jgi:hypothetical protein